MWSELVNNIQLTWKLAWLLRTYRTCNSTVWFSKYKFYNKLFGGVILLRVTLGVIWTQPYIYIYISQSWEKILLDSKLESNFSPHAHLIFKFLCEVN